MLLLYIGNVIIIIIFIIDIFDRSRAIVIHFKRTYLLKLDATRICIIRKEMALSCLCL